MLSRMSATVPFGVATALSTQLSVLAMLVGEEATMAHVENGDILWQGGMFVPGPGLVEVEENSLLIWTPESVSEQFGFMEKVQSYAYDWTHPIRTPYSPYVTVLRERMMAANTLTMRADLLLRIPSIYQARTQMELQEALNYLKAQAAFGSDALALLLTGAAYHMAGPQLVKLAAGETGLAARTILESLPGGGFIVAAGAAALAHKTFTDIISDLIDSQLLLDTSAQLNRDLLDYPGSRENAMFDMQRQISEMHLHRSNMIAAGGTVLQVESQLRELQSMMEIDRQIAWFSSRYRIGSGVSNYKNSKYVGSYLTSAHQCLYALGGLVEKASGAAMWTGGIALREAVATFGISQNAMGQISPHRRMDSLVAIHDWVHGMLYDVPMAAFELDPKSHPLYVLTVGATMHLSQALLVCCVYMWVKRYGLAKRMSRNRAKQAHMDRDNDERKLIVLRHDMAVVALPADANAVHARKKLEAQHRVAMLELKIKQDNRDEIQSIAEAALEQSEAKEDGAYISWPTYVESDKESGKLGWLVYAMLLQQPPHAI